VPIVSGNVSLYNETAGRAIPPTPAVGMVGLLEDVALTVPTRFEPDCAVIHLGDPPAQLCASEYLAENDRFPRFDLTSERRLLRLLRDLAHQRLLRSAQDVADGGLAVALAECAMLGGTGAILQVEALDTSMEVALFSEDQGRAVVTCAPEAVQSLMELAARYSVVAIPIGTTGGDRLQVRGAFDVSVEELRRAWEPQP
jgi:phosphoribosylformylglycinamidine synthase